MRGVTPEANVGDFPASDGYTLSRADPMRHARCSSPFCLALAIGLTLSAPIVSAQGGRRGPPKTGSFQTDVPPIALNAILARPTSTAVTLSLLSAADRDVVVVLEGEAPRRLPQHLRAGEPASVELTITETEPGIQGDRVSGARKPATLETGKVVQVPLFVNIGDRVKVDTRSGDYITRV